MTTALARLAGRQPRLALMLASAVGGLRNRVTRRWPTRDEVASLFPDLSPRRAASVAAAVGSLEERNMALVRCVRRSGLDPFRPLVAIPDALRSMNGPCILVTFHVGAIHTLGAALEALGAPVLSFRHGSLVQLRPPVESQSSAGNEQQRASAFMKARRYLQKGGFVLMALDAGPGATIETECFGRPLALARGAFALARVTGAPMVPLTGRWTRQGAQALVDVPLVPAETFDRTDESLAFEQTLAQSASHWLEHYLRDTPRELTLGLLRELLYGTAPPTSIGDEATASLRS